MSKAKNKTTTFSVRVTHEELAAWKRLAKKHDLSLNKWIRDSIDASMEMWHEWTSEQLHELGQEAETAPADQIAPAADDRLTIDWQAMCALAAGMDHWFPEDGEHQVQDALEFLFGLAKPLAAGDVQIFDREARQALEAYLELERAWTEYLDGVLPDSAPHNGRAEVHGLIRSVIEGKTMVAGRELYDHLKRMERRLETGELTIFETAAPDGAPVKQTHMSRKAAPVQES